MSRIISICLLACYLFCGCGGGGGGGGTSNPSANNGAGGASPNVATASIILNSVLLRAIPQDISTLRVSGFGSGRQLTFGPATFAKAPQIVVTGVPVNTLEIQIEYLRGGVTRGIYNGPVSLQANQSFTITDPNFLDVEAQLVSLEVSPGPAVVPGGLSVQFQATGVFDDNSRSDLTEVVAWSASNGNVTVSNIAGSKGRVTGVTPGSSEVIASLGGVTRRVSVSVTSATLLSLTVSGTPSQLPRGSSLQLSVLGALSDGTQIDLTQSADWTSSDTSKLTVSRGLVRAANLGSAFAIATINGVEGRLELTVVSATLTSLEVSPNTISLPLGLSAPVSVTARFSDSSLLDVTDQTQWVSSQPSVATVLDGRFQARGVGSASLTASYGGLNRVLPATVTAAVPQTLEIRYGLPQLPAGTREPLQAFAHYSDSSDRDVTSAVVWSSEDTSRVVVSNSLGEEGLATGILPGSAQIRASLQNLNAGYTLIIGNRAIFVRNNASPGGNGSFSRPLTTLGEAVTQAPNNTTIFVFAGDGTTAGYQQPVQLKTGQQLVGQAQGYAALNLPAGPAPRLGGTVTMAQNSRLAGVRFEGVTGVAVRGESVANLTLDHLYIDRCGLDAVSILNPSGDITLSNSLWAAPLQPQRALKVACAADYGGQARLEVTNCTFDGYAGSETEPLIEVTLAKTSATLLNQVLLVHHNLFRNHRGHALDWSGNGVRWTQWSVTNNTLENCGTLVYSNSTTNSTLAEMRLDGNSGTLAADFAMQLTPHNVTVGQMSVTGNRVTQNSGYFQNLQVAFCQNGTVANNQVTFTTSGFLTYLLDGYLQGSTPGASALTVTNNTFSGPFTSWQTRVAADGQALLSFKNNLTDCQSTLIESRYAGALDLSGNSGRILDLIGGLTEPFRVEQASTLQSVNSYTQINLTRITEVPDGSLGLP